MKYWPPLASIAALVLCPAIAAGDAGPTESGRHLLIDAGVSAARPVAMPTGLSSGVGAGVTFGRLLAWGARASWSSATEYTSSWSVRQSDIKLRAAGALQHTAGRGTIALRLAAGGTLVHEVRTRHQGERAGLTGEDLRTSEQRMLPGGELELAVALRIVGPWVAVVSGGPSLHLVGGEARSGWIGSLGAAWQP